MTKPTGVIDVDRDTTGIPQASSSLLQRIDHLHRRAGLAAHRIFTAIR
jgi:hypothetical protein